MASLSQLTIVFLLFLSVCASFGHAFDARFLNKAHHSASLSLLHSDVDLIDTKQSNLSNVFLSLSPNGELSLQTDTPFSSLSFKLKRHSGDTICNVTIEGLFSARPTPKEECPMAQFQISTSTDPISLQLDVNTFTEGGFAIWDLVADGSVQLPISRLTHRYSFSRPLETYVLQSSKLNSSSSVYFSLPVDVDLLGNEMKCLTVDSSIDGARIETHYALSAWASSNRSAKAPDSDVFCPGRELFLQGLGPLQVTFTVTNIAELVKKEDASPLYFSVFPAGKGVDSIIGSIALPESDAASENYRWIFYNPATFKYNVTSEKPIQICDMLENCYQMEEVVNGTVAKDASKQYIVPEKVHRLLKYTPVVRMLSANSNYESQYFRGYDETNSRVFSHFTSLNAPVQLEDGRRLHFTVNATTSGHAPNILSLPIHLLDQRALSFTLTLNASQSDLILESVNLQFGTGSSLNQSSIPLHLPVGKRVTLSSLDFFKLKAHSLPSAGSQLSNFQVAYRTAGQPEGEQVRVGVTIEVSSIDDTLATFPDSTTYGPLVKFSHLTGGEAWHSARSPIDGRMTVSLSKGNPSALLLSSWIPAANANLERLNRPQGHIRLSYQSTDGRGVFPQKGLRVKQIIWGFAKGEYTLEEALQPNLHDEVGNYIFQEIRIQRRLLNDRYRIAYLISLEEKVDRRVEVDFEWNFEEIGNTLPSSTLCKGPTYGDVFCRIEPYICPEHYFKVNQDTGNCEMINKSH